MRPSQKVSHRSKIIHQKAVAIKGTRSRPLDGSLPRCGSLINYEEGCRSAAYGTTIRHQQHLLFFKDGIFGEAEPPSRVVVSHDLFEMSMEIE